MTGMKHKADRYFSLTDFHAIRIVGDLMVFKSQYLRYLNTQRNGNEVVQLNVKTIEQIEMQMREQKLGE